MLVVVAVCLIYVVRSLSASHSLSLSLSLDSEESLPYYAMICYTIRYYYT